MTFISPATSDSAAAAFEKMDMGSAADVIKQRPDVDAIVASGTVKLC